MSISRYHDSCSHPLGLLFLYDFDRNGTNVSHLVSFFVLFFLPPFPLAFLARPRRSRSLAHSLFPTRRRSNTQQAMPRGSQLRGSDIHHKLSRGIPIDVTGVDCRKTVTAGFEFCWGGRGSRSQERMVAPAGKRRDKDTGGVVLLPIRSLSEEGTCFRWAVHCITIVL